MNIICLYMNITGHKEVEVAEWFGKWYCEDGCGCYDGCQYSYNESDEDAMRAQFAFLKNYPV